MLNTTPSRPVTDHFAALASGRCSKWRRRSVEPHSQRSDGTFADHEDDAHVYRCLWPRLTGSPNHKAAAEWAVKQMTAWGLENAHLEPWDFKHPGWLNERLTAHLISPVKDPLVCEVLAWTPEHQRNRAGKGVQVDSAGTSVAGTAHDFLEQLTKRKCAGESYWSESPLSIPVNLNPPPKRLS